MNRLPDTAALSHYLSGLISEVNHQQTHIDIVSRKPFINSSTFPAEIVTCKINNEKVKIIEL